VCKKVYKNEAPALTQSIDRLAAAVERVEKALQGIIAAQYGSSLATALIIAAKTDYERNAAIKDARATLNAIVKAVEK
jgi:flagellar biosynthesis regulator FlaF